MSWVDFLAVAIVIGIAFAESHRGFGLALFDTIGAVISVKLAIALAPSVARGVSLGFSSGEAEAFWLAALFFVFAVLTLLASRLIYQTTQLSLDVMDPTIGAILGVVSGLITAHIVVRTMVLGAAGTQLGRELAQTFVVRQLIEFQGYQSFLEVVRHLGE